MGKRYYWLKLKKDFFSDKRIKKLRKIAGGDTYTIIYLKLMLSTLDTDGVYEFEGIESYLADEIALVLDEDADNVQIALNYLFQSGLMVELDENNYELPMVKESIGSETPGAERIRRFRERQKALQCNTDVTQEKHFSNIEIEKREEIELEKREEKKTDYQQIVDMYNETCVSFPRLKILSDARKKVINARMKTYTLDDFHLLFEKAEASRFLKGGNDRNWSANFDWLIKDANMVKVLEGNYDDKPGAGKPNNKFNQFPQNNYDFNELEEQLLDN